MFAGKTFFVHRVNNEADVIQSIVNQGGTITPDLSVDVSYFVTTPAEAKASPKSHQLNQAIEWGIPVLSDSFIPTSLASSAPSTAPTSPEYEDGPSSTFDRTAAPFLKFDDMKIETGQFKLKHPLDSVFNYGDQDTSGVDSLEEDANGLINNVQYYAAAAAAVAQENQEDDVTTEEDEKDLEELMEFSGGDRRSSDESAAATDQQQHQVNSCRFVPGGNALTSSSSSSKDIKNNRYEWRKLLTIYLSGAEIEEEKARLIGSGSDDGNPAAGSLAGSESESTAIRLNLWKEIRARELCIAPNIGAIDSTNAGGQSAMVIEAFDSWLDRQRPRVQLLLDRLAAFRIEDSIATPCVPIGTDLCVQLASARGNISAIYEQVGSLLEQLGDIDELFPSKRRFVSAFAQQISPSFIERMEALNAWYSIMSFIVCLESVLKKWTNVSDLNVYGSTSDLVDTYSLDDLVRELEPATAEFIEILLKERGISGTFNSRLINAVAAFVAKTLSELEQFHGKWIEMNLPLPVLLLVRLCSFPTKLIKNCLRLRLKTRVAIMDGIEKEPAGNGGIMLDQILDDLRSLLTVSVRVKQDFCDVAQRLLSKVHQSHYCEQQLKFQSSTLVSMSHFTGLVLGTMQFYSNLVQIKFKPRQTFLWSNDMEALGNEWNFLVEIGQHIDGGLAMVSLDICALTSRVLKTIMIYYNTALEPPRHLREQALIKWFTRLLENVRMRSRKTLNFIKAITDEMENSCEMQLSKFDLNLPILLERCLQKGFVLVDSSITASEQANKGELAAGADSIIMLAFLPPGSTATAMEQLLYVCGSLQYNPQRPSRQQFFGYVIFVNKPQNFTWAGARMMIDWRRVLRRGKLELKADRIRLVSPRPGDLATDRQRFLKVIADFGSIRSETNVEALRRIPCNAIMILRDKRAVSSDLHRSLLRIRRLTLRFAETMIGSLPLIRRLTGSATCVDLIEGCFSFASDFGYRTARLVGSTRGHDLAIMLNRKLIDLAVDWVTFTCSDCSPLDKRTFRWALLALEYVSLITRGRNIEVLTEEAFSHLRSKVACCMTLLISHFDSSHQQLDLDEFGDEIDGMDLSTFTGEPPTDESNNESADPKEINERRLAERMSQLARLEDNRVIVLQRNRMVGKVLDTNSLRDQGLDELIAASSSTLSIRWQQGRYIGGGTFGSVYVGTNLDSGEVIAVKEIKFQDPASIKKLTKNITKEMAVMEKLNSPNIVSYYGIEIHRDKCYIFMEYCSGGSLTGLLENGMIEDESIIQLYTYQLLCGVEYLHSQRIIHRDIKPDNILFDHNGILKLVDFGAAKIVASKAITLPGKPTLVGTPNYMCPEMITGSINQNQFGSQDIWSVGCVVLEMRSGKRPWHHLDNEWAIMYQIGVGSRHPPLPELASENDSPGSFTISAAGLDFLDSCFRPANVRPAAVHLLQHAFFADMHSKLADYRRRFPDQNQAFPNPWNSMAGFAKGLHSPGFSPSISALLNQRRTSYFSRSHSSTVTTNNGSG